MLAVLQKVDHGYTARYERRLNASVDQVWSMLTDNDQLAKWFAELRVGELRDGGFMKFDMQNGTFEKLDITELRLQSVLEYTWGEDLVRFELYPETAGSRLVLVETINKMTDHTPKDLAGWDVCLDVVEALLSGRKIEAREDLWKAKYEEYVQAVGQVIRA
ncbi:SRPBCC family protein [Paenibacillus piri]|uniref:SRPBCC family protein n=1 Tax=Paenibacillus piri TaxID=2547395 RepID=A0A4R5K9G5_9BACL|nr:SRPBCC family protein [Paenibacillus piri]TDF88905.1 SRPBCC family protein [Paenibacillus piri]